MVCQVKKKSVLRQSVGNNVKMIAYFIAVIGIKAPVLDAVSLPGVSN